MLIRPIRLEEKDLYNSVINHPVQSWEWGEFQQKLGKKIERVGFFENGKLKQALMVIFQPLPKLPQYSIGYCPRAFSPTAEQLAALKQLGQNHQALFIRLEPNLSAPADNRAKLKPAIEFLLANNCVLGRPFFYQHTFTIDLSLSQEELQANLKNKTRYNINLATKKGVTIVEDSSSQGLKTYQKILKETLKRKGFYLHSPAYFQKMWETLHHTQLLKIFHARYEDTTLASWIMFKWNDHTYYPYGASSAVHKEVMASNLMMWEMIMWSKKIGAKLFDMWGSLGDNPDTKHPWYGFHRFKEGYGGQPTQFMGTFDLVLLQPHYKLFRILDNWRWRYLRLKTTLGLS